DQTEVNVAVLADRPVVHVDLHECQLVADTPSVAHAEVEWCSDYDKDIRLREGIAPSPVEMMRVSGRQQTTAATVEVTRDIKATQQRNRFPVSTRSPHLLPVQNGRPLGVDENVGQLFQIARIADRAGGGTIVTGLWHDRLGRIDLAIQHIARY